MFKNGHQSGVLLNDTPALRFHIHKVPWTEHQIGMATKGNVWAIPERKEGHDQVWARRENLYVGRTGEQEHKCN